MSSLYSLEAQPIPNPLSWYLHQLPEVFQAFSVLINHWVELIAPFLVVLPFRSIRHFGGICLIGFQVLLILSGNLSFLNWLTIVPSLASFDDFFWFPFCGDSLQSKVKRLHLLRGKSFSSSWQSFKWWTRTIFVSLLCLLVAYLSIHPIQNLFSSRQAMNRSYDRLDLVNSYGNFGSVGKERPEIVLEAQWANSSSWIELEFKCKPGNVSRRPCIAAPYHYRFDWQVWFAAMGNYQQNPWLIHFVGKLLEGDSQAESLIEPLPREDPPVSIRAKLYKYRFTHWSEHSLNWWKRTFIGDYFPPLSLNNPSLRRFLHQFK